MKFVVCVKQVPDTENVETDPETGTLKRGGVAAVINPFDMFAIEESVRMKKRFGGEVTAVSMGPPPASYALKDCVAMGVDSGLLLSDRAFAGADTVATAYAIAQGIKKMGEYDVVLCGVKTVDGDTAQVGPMVAEELGIPHVCYVSKIVDIKDGKMLVERGLDDRKQTLSVKLPALITVTKEINEPHYPTLEEKLSSKEKEIEMKNAEQVDAKPERLGLNGSPTQVVKVFPPEKKKKGEIFEDTPATSAGKVIDWLYKKDIL